MLDMLQLVHSLVSPHNAKVKEGKGHWAGNADNRKI